MVKFFLSLQTYYIFMSGHKPRLRCNKAIALKRKVKKDIYGTNQFLCLEYDIKRNLKAVGCSLDMDFEFIQTKSRQDEGTAFEYLPCYSQLNIEEDVAVAEYIVDPPNGLNPTKITKHYPSNPISLIISNQRATKRLENPMLSGQAYPFGINPNTVTSGITTPRTKSTGGQWAGQQNKKITTSGSEWSK